MAEKRDPHIVALESVYAALKDLDVTTRKKVLSSAFALLGIEESPNRPAATLARREPESGLAMTAARPTSIIELLQAKQPGSNAQRIALFAYYREKYENLPRFSREDLKPYFSKAKEPPASNFDRDFVEAVRKGWIHEESSDSYLTTKGVEAVESGFEGELKRTRKDRKSAKRPTARKRSPRKPKR